MKKDDNSSPKGYIIYRYNGNKLSKTVHEEGVAEDKVTDYAGGMVYKNILQFILHEEGRTRLTNTRGVITQNYDYFIKDHLGNVRMVLTDEVQKDIYPAATLEGNINASGTPNAINVEQGYYKIDTTSVVNKSEAVRQQLIVRSCISCIRFNFFI